MVLGIARLLGKTKAADYARNFMKETRARDLTVDEAENVKTVVKDPTPDVAVEQRALTSFTKSQDYVKTKDEAFQELVQKVEKQPLTMGGTAVDNELYGVGPALFDYIVKMPVKKALPAREWANLFKGNLELNYIEPNTGFAKKISVPKQELEDAGIIAYDRKNNVQSGILKDLMDDADGKNAPISKQTLLSFVRGSPSNNIKVIRRGTDLISDRAETFMNDLRTLTNQARDSFDATRGLNLEQLVNRRGMSMEAEKVADLKETLASLNYTFSMGLSRGGEAFSNEAFSRGQKILNSLKNFEGVDQTGIAKLEAQNQAFAKIFDGREIAKNFKRHEKGKNINYLTKEQGAEGYRILGGKNYFEDILYVDDRLLDSLPPDVKRFYSARHFAEDPTGRPIYGQLLHLRGGTRGVRGPGNESAVVLDEIQSDLNQEILRDAVKVRDNFVDKLVNSLPDAERNKLVRLKNQDIFKYQDNDTIKNFSKQFYESEAFKNMRSNPFNRTNLNELIHQDEMYNIGSEMIDIAKKGRYQTAADIDAFNKLADRADFIRSQGPRQSNVVVPKTGENVVYNPLMDKKEWSSLGLKYAMKKAANDGHSWVAINPFEMVAYKRTHDRKVGLMEFYGNYKGDGSAKNLKLESGRTGMRDMSPKVKGKDIIVGPATIPNRMRDLAKKYNTEVKTIDVAKSDPDKPFKVIGSTKKNFNVDTGEEVDFEEHLGAFATLDDVPLAFRSQVKRIDKGDDALYYKAYAIKVKPEMKDMPMSTYKRGGLVVNLFEWK